MATPEAFLRTITADPDDPAPRLVFADWLEDHDEHDRAEFIRLQMQIDGSDLNRHYYNPILARERDMLRTHRRAWRAPILQAYRNVSSSVGHVRDSMRALFWRNGFPEGAYMTPAGYARFRNAMPSLMPLRYLKIMQNEEDGHILSVPNIRELDLAQGRFENVWQLRDGTRLQCLNLTMNNILAHMPSLQRSSLPALRHLILNNCRIREGIQEVLRLPFVPQLRGLTLSGARINARAANILLDHRDRLPELETLYLHRNRYLPQNMLLQLLDAFPKVRNFSPTSALPDELKPHVQDILLERQARLGAAELGERQYLRDTL